MIIHRANSRGYFNHGWLRTHHTFSFAEYYDPLRMHFGKLRVLNDDFIEGGSGFGLHPHNNMEIISIPIAGALKHSDNRGSDDVINEIKVQVMSAGKGISHSEHNALTDKTTNFLQIWIYPRTMNVEPRYESREFDPLNRENKFQLLVSSDGRDGSLFIHQKAYLSRIAIDASNTKEYKAFNTQNGIYFFVIDGKVQIGNEFLESRDGAGTTESETIQVSALTKTDLLVIEVPMN